MARAEQNTDERADELPLYVYDAEKGGFAFALDDIRKAVSRPRFVKTLVISAFLAQYRGAMLGAFWITLTTLATVTGLAVVYAQVLGEPLGAFYGYVAVGVIIWTLIADLVISGTSALMGGATIYNQIPMPRSVFVLRMAGLSLVTFAFKLPVLIGVLLLTGDIPGIDAILISFAGFALIVWSGVCFGLFAGTAGARFRDLGQLVSAALLFIFFLTPIFWQPDRLGEFEFIVDYNPLYHYIHVVRAPLLGLEGVGESFLWAGGFTLALTVLGAAVFGAFARRLNYWS